MPVITAGGITFSVSFRFLGFERLHLITQQLQRLGTVAKEASTSSQRAAARSVTDLRHLENIAASAATTYRSQMTQAAKAKTEAAKQAADTVRQTTKATVESYSDLRGVLGALGGVWASTKLTGLVVESTKYAAQVETLGVVMQQVGITAHYTASELNAIEHNTRKLGITTEAARQTIAQLSRAQVDLKHTTSLARIAQDAAVLAGENSSETTMAITQALYTLQPRLLKTRGILVNLAQEYSRFAKEQGRVVLSLSEEEKREIMLQAVLRQGVSLFGAYESAMSTTGKQAASMQRYQQEAMLEFGKQFDALYKIYVQSSTEFLKSFAGASDETKALAASAITATVAFVSLASAMSAVKIIGAGVATSLGPAGWAIMGVSAALSLAAASMVYATARSEALRREFEKQKADAAAAATEMLTLRSTAKEITAYGAMARLTAGQQSDLNYQMETAIGISGKYADRLRAAKGSVAEFLAVLKQVVPEVGKTDSQLLNEAQTAYTTALDRAAEKLSALTGKSLPEARKEIEQAIAAGERLQLAVSGRLTAGGQEELVRKVKELSDSYTETAKRKAAMDAQSEAGDMRALRALDERQKSQATAAELASRALAKLEEERTKGAKSTALDVLTEYREYLGGLSGAVMTESEILRQSTLEWETRQQNIATLQRKARLEQNATKIDVATGREIDVDPDKAKAMRAEEQKQLEAAREATRQQAKENFQQQADILRAHSIVGEIVDRRIEATREELTTLQQETALVESGVDARLAQTDAKIRETLRGHESALSEFSRAMQGDVASEDALALEASKQRIQAQLASNKLSADEKQLALEQVALLQYRIDLLRGGFAAEKESSLASIAHLKSKIAIDQKDMQAVADLAREEDRLARIEQKIAKARELESLQEKRTLAEVVSLRQQKQKAIDDANKSIAETDQTLLDRQKAIATERAKILGNELQTLEQLRSELKKVQDEMRGDAADVAAFLDQKMMDQREKEKPGTKAISDLLAKYKELVSKADFAQLPQLGDMFRVDTMDEIRGALDRVEQLKREYQEAQVKGDNTGMARVWKEGAAAEQRLRNLRELAPAAREQLAWEVAARQQALEQEAQLQEQLAQQEEQREQEELAALDEKDKKLQTEAQQRDRIRQSQADTLKLAQQELDVLDHKIAKLKRLAEGVGRERADKPVWNAPPKPEGNRIVADLLPPPRDYTKPNQEWFEFWGNAAQDILSGIGETESDEFARPVRDTMPDWQTPGPFGALSDLFYGNEPVRRERETQPDWTTPAEPSVFGDLFPEPPKAKYERTDVADWYRGMDFSPLFDTQPAPIGTMPRPAPVTAPPAITTPPADTSGFVSSAGQAGAAIDSGFSSAARAIEQVAAIAQQAAKRMRQLESSLGAEANAVSRELDN